MSVFQEDTARRNVTIIEKLDTEVRLRSASNRIGNICPFPVRKKNALTRKNLPGSEELSVESLPAGWIDHRKKTQLIIKLI